VVVECILLLGKNINYKYVKTVVTRTSEIKYDGIVGDLVL
jgi:hypothetical protein